MFSMAKGANKTSPHKPPYGFHKHTDAPWGEGLEQTCPGEERVPVQRRAGFDFLQLFV